MPCDSRKKGAAAPRVCAACRYYQPFYCRKAHRMFVRLCFGRCLRGARGMPLPGDEPACGRFAGPPDGADRKTQ